MKNRTEHNLKNRFFGLLAKCNGTKIKVAKKTIDYKDLSILKKLKLYIQQA